MGGCEAAPQIDRRVAFKTPIVRPAHGSGRSGASPATTYSVFTAGTKGAQGWGPQKPPVLVVVAGLRVFGVPLRGRLPVLHCCPLHALLSLDNESEEPDHCGAMSIYG